VAITLIPALDTNAVLDPAGNTYVTLLDAHDYFESRLNADDWERAPQPRQQQALLTAMRILETLPWIGAPLLVTQPLAWPRVATCPAERENRKRIQTGYETPTGATRGIYDRRGRAWTVAAIPLPICHAQCEIALAMLQDQSLNEGQMRNMLIRTSNAEIDYRLKAGSAPVMAMEYLNGFLLNGTAILRA
jgi:hypothetical protein